jgi:hypothetical protein
MKHDMARWGRRHLLWLLLLAPAVAIAGFVALVFLRGVHRGDIMLAPGSRDYRTNSPREKAVFPRARRDVFPSQVRADLARYRQTVAWAGILDDFSLREEGDSVVVRMYVAHRYFDWIEDHGIQRARYFLSPRGDGRFAAAVAMPREYRKGIEETTKRGDMMIVYGVPAELRGDLIVLNPTEHVRPVPRALWRDDVLEYGRPGEPVHQLSKF